MDLLLAIHRYTYKDSEIGSAFHNPKHLVAQNTLTLAQYCLRFRRFVQQVSFTFLFIMLFFLYNNSTLSNCFTNCLGLRPLRVKFSCLSLAIFFPICLFRDFFDGKTCDMLCWFSISALIYAEIFFDTNFSYNCLAPKWNSDRLSLAIIFSRDTYECE